MINVLTTQLLHIKQTKHKTMTIKNTLRNLIGTVMVAAASTLPFSGKADGMAKPYVQTTLASDYISAQGSGVREAGRQDWISMSAKGATAGIFQNQFFSERSISERDFCASYSRPVSSNLTGTVGAQYWDYPNKRFGKFDSVEVAGLDYSGKINASLAYTHLNNNSKVEDGDRIALKVSKPFSLVDGKTKVNLTPFVSSAYINNFYGCSGIPQVSAGLTLGVSHGKVSANLTGTAQKSLDSDAENLIWGTASVGYQF